jgi:N-acetylglutamate synthase-like GNAT family acetyltransferase
MSFRIRPATQADQPVITALVRASGINPLNLDWPRFRVAEDAGRVVGVAQIKTHGDASRELASLAVAPDRQGEGIGGALIEYWLDQPEGQPPLFLMCRNELESYYTRFGFRRVGRAEMPAYFRRMTRVAAVFMGVAALFGERRHIIVMRYDGALLTADAPVPGPH